MPDELPSEILGQPGVFPFLAELHSNQELLLDQVPDLMADLGVKAPASLYGQLKDISIIFEATDKLYLSARGQELWWLLQAINGLDPRQAFQHLSRLDPTLFPYEIVTEGMTAEFIDGLDSNPTFRRVLLCSPWISLKKKALQKFSFAVYKAREKTGASKIEIIAIAQPLKKKHPQYEQFREVFVSLQKLGAEIVVHEKLHSKLYIRDPGPAGGISQAIFGSENLTSKRNIELGIRITNDTAMINKLIRYFHSIYQQCQPFEED
jgi:hypothetical protein